MKKEKYYERFSSPNGEELEGTVCIYDENFNLISEVILEEVLPQDSLSIYSQLVDLENKLIDTEVTFDLLSGKLLDNLIVAEFAGLRGLIKMPQSYI